MSLCQKIESQWVVNSNEYVASELLIYLHGDKIEDSDKQDIVSNIEFESIKPSIKNNLFYQRMMNFVNKLELDDHKYQTDGNVGDENYKGKFLFPMKYFVSFVTDFQSMYLMSTIF